jgi:hypothetical protein
LEDRDPMTCAWSETTERVQVNGIVHGIANRRVGRRGRCHRFRAPVFDSFGGELEGGEAEHQSSSEEL